MSTSLSHVQETVMNEVEQTLERLTKREYFAGLALQTILKTSNWIEFDQGAKERGIITKEGNREQARGNSEERTVPSSCWNPPFGESSLPLRPSGLFQVGFKFPPETYLFPVPRSLFPFKNNTLRVADKNSKIIAEICVKYADALIAQLEEN